MKVWALKNVVEFWMQINMMTVLIRAISYLSVCLTHMEREGASIPLKQYRNIFDNWWYLRKTSTGYQKI